MNLQYAAICTTLSGKKCVRVGNFDNQPTITAKQFREVKSILYEIDPELRISKQQAQIYLNNDGALVNFRPTAATTVKGFLRRSDIRKLCGKIEPTFDFQSEAKLQLENYLKIFIKKYLEICSHLITRSKMKKMNPRVCEFAFKLLLSGEIVEPALAYAKRAVNAFEFIDNRYAKGKTQSTKSNLIISVSKIKQIIDSCDFMVNMNSAVYTAGLIEYIILDLATLCAENNDNAIASKALLDMVVYSDSDLAVLFQQRSF